MRRIYRSQAFEEFCSTLDSRTKKKVDYVLGIVRNERIISTKFVKKIIGTEFYELLLQTDNEYRIIIFAMDSDNIISANEVILLNGFTKKSNSDYSKQIIIARNICLKENYIEYGYRKEQK